MPSLRIHQPCAESWATMTPASGGRHCAACQKTVVDFTYLADAEILAYFQRATSETCGRFRPDQQHRPLAVVAGVRPRRVGAARRAAARAPRPAEHPRKKISPPHPPASPAPKLLRGTVRDAATQAPLAGVAVFLKGENRSAMTDSAGHFSLRLPGRRPRAGRALHYVGYQSHTVAVPTSAAAALQLELLADPAAGATIVGYGSQRQQHLMGGIAVMTIQRELQARPTRSFWQRITQPCRQ